VPAGCPLGLLPAEWFGTLLIWEQLSNSGEFLKFFIPNLKQKIINGWSNYSGKVTNKKISIKRKIEYLGSKLDFICKSIKEQRVNGSWHKILFFVFKIYSKEFREKLSFQNPITINKTLEEWV
jgi:hypothetical protein